MERLMNVESSMYNWGDQTKNLKINEPNFLIYSFSALKELLYRSPK